MALDITERIEIANRYAPVLYFHPDERFFPSDPKTYIEHCTLWRTRAPATTTADWGEEQPSQYPKSPIVGQQGISAVQGSTEPGSSKWLGDLLPAGSAEDRFLGLRGWQDSGFEVSDTSENRFASLDEVERLYANTDDLDNSRFWFYAEVFDTAYLYGVPGEEQQVVGELNPIALLDRLNDPRLVLYHLFYPAHEEPLEGCENWGAGRQFASFVGEWACVGVLEQGVYSDAGILIGHRPTHLGLTQRNTGVLTGLGNDKRLAMTVVPWASVSFLPDAPDSARIVVARGTHSMYSDITNTDPRVVAPFTSENFDISRDSCGRVEQLDDTLGKLSEMTEEIYLPPHDLPPIDAEMVLVKLASALAGIATGLGYIGGLGVGYEGVLELITTFGSSFAGVIPATTTPAPPPASTPTDVTPTPEKFGIVIGPDGVVVPGAGGAHKTWRTSEMSAPGGFITAPSGRTYGFIVDRPTQVWWPSGNSQTDTGVQFTVGYDGRWGLAVTHDPRSRRSGMRAPQFWRLLLTGLALAG